MNNVKSQAKSAVDREAVHMLAIEIGAREAARRLGIKESTVLSWARRYGWNLPKRKDAITKGAIKGAIKQAQSVHIQLTPSEALREAHEDYERVTKTALMQILAKAAKALAAKDALPMETITQFKDACLAGAKLFG